MYATLVAKEIRESILTHWFYMVSMICIVLIPFGLYFGTVNYRQNLVDYRESIRLYQDKTNGMAGVESQVEGFRPPSPLSVFDSGIQNEIPSKVIASPDGVVRMIDEPGMRNPHAGLFGSFDFHFTVSVVLSLLALVFTFNTVTGEKESGTLRLIMSNPVPRWKVLAGKLAGRYILFLIPFTIAILAGMILIYMTDSSIITGNGHVGSFVAIVVLSYLFIFTVCSLGIMLSAMTHHSMLTVMAGVLIWIFLVFGIPKISPMIAQVVYPVKSPQIVNTEKQLIRQDLEEELKYRRSALFEETMAAHGITDWQKVYQTSERQGPEIDNDAFRDYDVKAAALVDEYFQRIADEYALIDNKYTNELNRQSDIARYLARLSPVSCYSFLVSDLSGTGLDSLDAFRTAARGFQNQLNTDLYRKGIKKIYGRNDGPQITNYMGAHLPIPEMILFSYPTTGKALLTGRVDILLLVFYAVLFFAAAFVSFLRYDVR